MGWEMGLEPTTTGITIRDSTNWAIPTIILFGLPDRNRTCDPLLRRQMLYPTELRADAIKRAWPKNSGRGEEIRTPDILLPKQTRYQTALHPVRNRILHDCEKKANLAS